MANHRKSTMKVSIMLLSLTFVVVYVYSLGLLASMAFVTADNSIQNNNNIADQQQQVCFADGTCRAVYDYDSVTNKQDATTSYDPLDDCGVYMAPSTLGEETSLGIYTAKELKQHDLINYPEIAIPLLFREWGEHTAGYDNDGVLWDRYIWEGNVVQLHTYDNTNIESSRSVFVPGVGCTINSVLDMNNLVSVYTSTYDNLKYNRYRDPGTGAFTPYVNAETKVAVESIEPGSELFANYGDSWIPSIPGAQVSLLSNLLVAEDFLLNDYYPFIRNHSKELTDDMKEALYEFTTKDFPIENPAMTNLPRYVSWNTIETEIVRYQEKYNSSDEQPPIVLKKLTITNPKPDEFEDDPQLLVKEFLKKQTQRTPEWLKANGYCQDHIRPDVSTIPQAGRGAFATRNLPTGTIVGYSPLIHIGFHGREIFTVEIPNHDDDETTRKQYDLIINYSFGHANSSVILTPYGGMINYINHASERTKQKPNVKVRWPNKELIAHKPWFLLKTPYDLKNTIDKIGLSFEYVAITDIQEGDEIFMDYGIEWEQAWEQHVIHWDPSDPEYDNHYIHTSEWMETTFRTVAELEKNPYPPNFETVCIESYTTKVYDDGNDDAYYNEWIDILRTDIPHRRHCNVLERYNNTGGNITYTVELMITKEEDEETEHVDEDTVLIVRNVPADGIVLVDKVFSADWHLPTAFRHEIMIPNDIMPQSWLNLIAAATTTAANDDDDDNESQSSPGESSTV